MVYSRHIVNNNNHNNNCDNDVNLSSIISLSSNMSLSTSSSVPPPQPVFDNAIVTTCITNEYDGNDNVVGDNAESLHRQSRQQILSHRSCESPSHSSVSDKHLDTTSNNNNNDDDDNMDNNIVDGLFKDTPVYPLSPRSERCIERNLHPPRISEGDDENSIGGNSGRRGVATNRFGNTKNNNNNNDDDDNTNNNHDDGFIDDLYAEYKARGTSTSSPKRVRRLKRFLLTRICPCILLLVGIILTIVTVKRRQQDDAFEESVIKDVPPATPITSTGSTPTLAPTGTALDTDAPSAFEVMTTVRDFVHNKFYKVRERAATQITHYRLMRTALIVNVQVLHQGGTAMCGSIGKSPQVKNGTATPAFVCWKTTSEDKIPTDYPAKYPWKYSETASNIHIVRRRFHFVAWEFHESTPAPTTLQQTDWDDPNLVSIFVIRHPFERMFTPDAIMNKKFPGIFVTDNATVDEWWNFSRSEYTNNYALRVLAGRNTGSKKGLTWCCSGENTSRVHLNHAKQLLKRFTFIIDMSCLNEGIQAVSGILNISLFGKYTVPRTKITYDNVEETINDYHVYQYLQQRNELDIELYEWAKERSLIDCSKYISTKVN